MKTNSPWCDQRIAPKKSLGSCAFPLFLSLLSSCSPLVKTPLDPQSAQELTPQTSAPQSTETQSTKTQRNIAVEVRGFTNSDGRVRVALYRGKDDFNQPDKAWTKQSLELPKKEPLIWNINLDQEALRDGQALWAVSAHHDKNANDKLDKNAFGIPTEPYGFSNNPKRGFGPPSFDEVSFKINDDEPNDRKVIEIKIK